MEQSILNRSRLDKFSLIMDLPLILKRESDPIIKDKHNPDTVQFTVFGSPVPAIKIPTINLAYGGQNVSVSSHSRPAYPDLNLKFLIDNGYMNYWILWKWLNHFNDSFDGTTDVILQRRVDLTKDVSVHGVVGNTFFDFTTNINLLALDEYNNPIASFKYADAYISSLSELNFSHQDESIISCTATFAYSQFHVELLANVGENTQYYGV
jgi:hypothetical protein